MKRKREKTKVVVRSTAHQELLLTGKYRHRVERDRTKFMRKQKHRHQAKDDGVFVSGVVNALLHSGSGLLSILK